MSSTKFVVLNLVVLALVCGCGGSGGSPSSDDRPFIPAGTSNPAATGGSSGVPGSVTLNWQPPTLNTDGSPLTDLAGYRIYFGNDAEELNSVIELTNPGLSSYMVEGLEPATWYFAMTAVNEAGVESAFSEQVAADTR